MKTLDSTELIEDAQKQREIREQKCLEEVTDVLKKYGCTIKCCVTFDEVSNQIIYDKKIVAISL